jgi:hypothetical protein
MKTRHNAPASLIAANLRNYLRKTMAVVSAMLFFAMAAGPATAEVKASGDNYLLYNNCNNVVGLTASLYVTQDMVAYVTPSDTPNGGFSMQLNANPPTGYPVTWMQYGIIVQSGQASAFIDYWDSAGIDNYAHPVILKLPSDTIAPGWILSITPTNDINGNVNGINYSVTNNAGQTTTTFMPAPVVPNTTTPVLAPIQSFQVDVVGTWQYADSTFSSGEGYLTYQVSSGELSVPANLCSNGQATGTGEESNIYYGPMSPSVNGTVTQAFASIYAGALSSNMDTAHNQVRLYNLTNPDLQDDLNVNQLAAIGATATNVGARTNVPAASLGSPIINYENTIYNAPEAFYLVPNSAGYQDVEQLWGATWSPTDLISTNNLQPAAAWGSGLAGFIDPIAGTDNVFYQGTDQYVHVLTWSPGVAWAEVSGANAPVAAFASALTGHMTASSEELFFEGTNQNIYELWRWSQNFDGWHATDISTSNGAKPAAAVGSPLAGFYDATAGTDAVFYVGANQHVYELLFSPSPTFSYMDVWSSIDMTNQFGAPLAGPGSMLAAHLNTTANSEEVFYINASGDLEELWSWETATPSWNPATLNTTYSPEAGSPLTTDMDSFASPAWDEVYYVGTDDVVHAMFWSAAGWLQLF